jgi:hypothetical protein
VPPGVDESSLTRTPPRLRSSPSAMARSACVSALPSHSQFNPLSSCSMAPTAPDVHCQRVHAVGALLDQVRPTACEGLPWRYRPRVRRSLYGRSTRRAATSASCLLWLKSFEHGRSNRRRRGRRAAGYLLSLPLSVVEEEQVDLGSTTLVESGEMLGSERNRHDPGRTRRSSRDHLKLRRSYGRAAAFFRPPRTRCRALRPDGTLRSDSGSHLRSVTPTDPDRHRHTLRLTDQRSRAARA